MLLTERGLGGDDADLTHRLDALRRDRAPRARDARAMARRWAETAETTLSPHTSHNSSPLVAGVGRGGREATREGRPARTLAAASARHLPPPPLAPPRKGKGKRGREARRRPSALFSPSPTPNGLRKTAAAEPARSSWPTAAARRSILRLRWLARHFSPWPSLPAAPRRAASCSPRRSHLPRSRRGSPTASTRARRPSVDPATAEPARAPAVAGSARLTLAEQAVAMTANAAAAPTPLAECDRAARGQAVLPWTNRPCGGRRDRRRLFLRAPPKARSGAHLPDAALAAEAAAMAGGAVRRARPTLRRASRRRTRGGATRRACRYRAAAPARGRGAHPFRGAVRLAGADRLRGGRRAEGRGPGAGAVRPRPPPERSPAAGCRLLIELSVAGAPAGAGDARSARLLARQLRRRARGAARPLSPKHPWPEDPLSAPATRRARPARAVSLGPLPPANSFFDQGGRLIAGTTGAGGHCRTHSAPRRSAMGSCGSAPMLDPPKFARG